MSKMNQYYMETQQAHQTQSMQDYKDKLTPESLLEWMGYGPKLPQEYLDHMERQGKDDSSFQMKQESKPGFEEPILF